VEPRSTADGIPSGLRTLLIGLIVIGIIFRFVNLNHKVYWHDEVYTSLRSAGYSRGEIDQAIYQNQILSAQELQRFQQLKPGSTWADTVRSLAVEDPQHPPLYFLLTRVWMQSLGGWLQQTFHSSLTLFRSLPALLSLLSLPLMYVLAWELFASRTAAGLATAFLAISPFDVLFAQTARQYGLLTTMVIASQWLLLRSLRRSTWQNWGLYALAIAVGLYTHPFFGLTIAAQIAFVGLRSLTESGRSQLGSLRNFVLSLVAALVLYSPWLWVMLTNRKRALDTTDWSQVSPGIDHLLKLWTLSFSSLFLDLDFGFTNPLTFLLRIPILLLLGWSLVYLYRRCDRTVGLSILTSILVPFLLLAGPDLILGGKRSAVSRYLISSYPGVQLAIAGFLASRWRSRAVMTWGILGLLVVSALASQTVSAAAFTWWNKDLSYFNAEVAQRLNARPTLVISEVGDDYTNTGDLISLSYLLNKDVRLLLIREPSWVKTPGFKAQIQGANPIVFRPSQALQRSLEQTFGGLQSTYPEGRLWKLPPSISRS
jgi:uncharacterized membrane protein